MNVTHTPIVREGSVELITRVLLVRHGRTALNAANLLRGHLDPDLDSTGRIEADLLANVLRAERLSLVLSSPLARAVQTARAIADRSGLRVEVESGFIDRDYGPWAGTSKEAVVARWGSLESAPDVESRFSVLSRARAALDSAARRIPNGALAIVSHDAVNRALLANLDDRFGDGDAIGQDTGCFNIVERRGSRWSVVSVNNVPSKVPTRSHPRIHAERAEFDDEEEQK